MNPSLIREDIYEEAGRIIQAAKERKLVLKLLGGLAIRFRCPSSYTVDSLKRTYKDIDFATTLETSKKLDALFSELGYVTDSVVNSLNWGERQIFYDTKNGRQIDIFVAKFSMCHKIPLSECCLSGDEATICLADLFLTKAQIVHLNEKDVRDMLVILLDHALDKSNEGTDVKRIIDITSGDWGFYHTIELNMEKMKRMLGNYSLTEEQENVITNRINDLLNLISQSPKTFGWKVRSKVGERIQWYDIPDEVC